MVYLALTEWQEAAGVGNNRAHVIELKCRFVPRVRCSLVYLPCTSTPSFNSETITTNTRRLMNGEEWEPMLPWCRGLTG